MSIGRQDYQAGVVPVKSGYSLVQSNYFDYESAPLAAAFSAHYCEYTVAVGYRLNVCGFRVTADKAYTHFLRASVAGSSKILTFFNTSVMDNFPEGVTLTVEAGEEFRITMYNEDIISVIFSVSVYGYLEQLIQ